MELKRFTFNLNPADKEKLDIIAKRKLYGSTSELLRELLDEFVSKKENREILKKVEEEK